MPFEPHPSRRGFSLVETIGVLAIIVILVCLLLPRIRKRGSKTAMARGTVQNARIEQAIVSIRSLKTAAEAHFARFGTLAPSGRSTVPSNGIDYGALLLREGFLSRPFALQMGTRTQVRLVRGSGLTPASPVYATPGAYDLNGNGHNDVVGANYVVEVVISGVPASGAAALDNRLDGSSPPAGAAGNDFEGRVIWEGASPNAPRQVHIYVTRG